MDKQWWDKYIHEVRRTFSGECYTLACLPPSAKIPRFGPPRNTWHGNSGSGCMQAAITLFGAKRIIMLGYDCSAAKGSHWHGDHPKGLGNAGSVAQWPGHFEKLAKANPGIQIVNASRDTVLTMFPRQRLEEALNIKESPVPETIIHGMHGLGDNLHQRAIVQHLMKSRRVWLETPWPSVYHDLIGDRLQLLDRGSQLRTQAKNAAREAGKFSKRRPPANVSQMKIWYPPDTVRRAGSVLAAMCAGANVPVRDFSLPVPDAWMARADKLIAEWQPNKPILFYRPLNERKEWSGCRARNPDYEAYSGLIESIREHFFVVSVADFQPTLEWMVGKPIKADVELHKGELDFETMAALIKRSALVYTSPGFAAVLGQAVKTPVCVVVGGYEDSSSFSAGATGSPYLGIDPIKPCRCFSHNHDCQKAIDMPKAIRDLRHFAGLNELAH